MIITLKHEDQTYSCDLSRPLDISIPLGQVRCFHAPPVAMTPYQSGDFIGSVKKGAPVNFYNVQLNPHGNGTHTESLGHITRKQESINKQFQQYHLISRLITVPLKNIGEADKVITVTALKAAHSGMLPPAVIIRTQPNTTDKLSMDYSDTNPPYVDKRAMQYLVDQGVKHLLIDLPSVDREVDKGLLVAHHIFWKVEGDQATSASRKECTITELIYVDNKVHDGLYLLNLQVVPLELDASPSRPVLFSLKQQL